MTDLFLKDAAGNYQTAEPVSKSDIIAFAYELLVPAFVGNAVIRSASDAEDFLRLALSDDMREQFGVIFLTTANQVITFEILATGNLTSAFASPRTVLTRVLDLGANAVIVAHNHPSGSSTPSAQDKAITKTLSDALRVIDVKLLDHIVIGCTSCFSFAENGLI